MEKCDQDTIMRSVLELTKLLDLNARYLSLLQKEYRVFSEQMVEDIVVSLSHLLSIQLDLTLKVIET